MRVTLSSSVPTALVTKQKLHPTQPETVTGGFFLCFLEGRRQTSDGGTGGRGGLCLRASVCLGPQLSCPSRPPTSILGGSPSPSPSPEPSCLGVPCQCAMTGPGWRPAPRGDTAGPDRDQEDRCLPPHRAFLAPGQPHLVLGLKLEHARTATPCLASLLLACDSFMLVKTHF